MHTEMDDKESIWWREISVDDTGTSSNRSGLHVF